MDQTTLVLLMTAALMARGDVSESQLISCASVQGERPQVSEIVLQRSSPKTAFKIEASDQATLRTLAAFMRRHNCRIRVEGYADDDTSASQAAAKQRASTIKIFLTEKLAAADRVRANQVEADGKGAFPGRASTPTQKRIAKIIL